VRKGTSWRLDEKMIVGEFPGGISEVYVCSKDWKRGLLPISLRSENSWEVET
jgi:hypothetical protein